MTHEQNCSEAGQAGDRTVAFFLASNMKSPVLGSPRPPQDLQEGPQDSAVVILMTWWFIETGQSKMS